MGRHFIDYYDNEYFTFSCKYCKIHFAHTDNIFMKHIETAHGECFGFVDSINTYYVDNVNYSTYTYHGDFDMYDDNSILKSNTNSYFLYCIKCDNFIGWKYCEYSAEKHIILKSVVH